MRVLRLQLIASAHAHFFPFQIGCMISAGMRACLEDCNDVRCDLPADGEQSLTPMFQRACRNNATFPRLADGLGFVQKDDIFHALKAIVATQRDYGRRDDRKFSRFKYLVEDWGIDKVRSVVEQYLGKAFEPLR